MLVCNSYVHIIKEKRELQVLHYGVDTGSSKRSMQLLCRVNDILHTKTKTINIKFKFWLTVFWSVLKANNLCVAAGPVSSDLTSIANTDVVSGSWQTYVIFSTGTLSVTD